MVMDCPKQLSNTARLVQHSAHVESILAVQAQQRQQELEKRGYRVLRFPNGIVLKAPADFVKKVGECIAELEQRRLKELRR